jgi:hypothetical protein
MDQEDRQIRRLLIAGTAVAIAGLVGTVVGVAILISTNFNPLNWLE